MLSFTGLRHPRTLGAAVAATALTCAAPFLATAGAASATTGSAAQPWWQPAHVTSYASIHLSSVKQIDHRLVELIFTTPYLTTPTYVRVLLPAHYAASRKRYPVLYLLDGCCNAAPQARDWTTPATKGRAEKITADDGLITVMPDSGEGGWYSDWYNNGSGGDPRWESYLIGQLVPWIDQHYRTIATRSGRAIAGLSMGGYGAMSLAARHPDMFVAASSFSGVVDSNDPRAAGPAVVDGLALIDGGIPGSVYGQRATQEVRWRAHNPWDLAGNLRGLALSLQTGNGVPGPFDTPSSGDVGGEIEAAPHDESVSLHNRFDDLGIANYWDDYGPGTHTWPYWNRDLTQILPRIMATFAHPPAPPNPFSFTAAESTFEAYGYVVSMHRSVMEFATLDDVTASGFTLAGSGTADVVTASRYRPGGHYLVTVTTATGARKKNVTADSTGRLHLHLDLGPSNTTQEYLGSTATNPTRSTFTTSVSFVSTH
jgi:S-formylglutathione hydrolase FrmB